MKFKPACQIKLIKQMLIALQEADQAIKSTHNDCSLVSVYKAIKSAEKFLITKEIKK